MGKDRVVLSTPEIASRCGVARSTVLRWIDEGIHVRGGLLRLPAFRVGKRARVYATDLEAFLACCNGESSPKAATKPHSKKKARK